MSNVLEHQKKEAEFVLYLEINGEMKLINFWDIIDPYTNTIERGQWIPAVVTGRRIVLVESLEKATIMSKLSEFSVWARESKEEVNAFLEKHNKEFSDIKIKKITYPEPIESDIDLDWSLI